MANTIKDIGLQINVINNKLARLPKHLKKAKRRGQLLAGRKMVKEIKVHVPKDTGNLKKSVGRIMGLKRTKNTFIGIRGGNKYTSDGWYGRLVEFGSYGKPGTPFWGKAVRAAKPIGEAILVAAAKNGFDGFKIENEK